MTTPQSAADQAARLREIAYDVGEVSAQFLHALAAELERAPGVTIGHGGTLSGTLPCGHDAKWLDVEERGTLRVPYCTRCWNAPPPPPHNRCSCCDAPWAPADPRWRMAGDRWEHQCRPDVPQAGYFASEPNRGAGADARDAACGDRPAPESPHPTPTTEYVSEWTHGCDALCTTITLWVRRCPHCGRPHPTPTRRAGAQHGDTAPGSGGDQDASARAGAPGSAPGDFPPRALGLTWGWNLRDGEDHQEWHAPCGCAYHPEPHPHVHPCSPQHDRATQRKMRLRRAQPDPVYLTEDGDAAPGDSAGGEGENEVAPATEPIKLQRRDESGRRGYLEGFRAGAKWAAPRTPDWQIEDAAPALAPAAPAPAPGDAPLTTTEMAERLASNSGWDAAAAIRWSYEVARAYLDLTAPESGDAEELARDAFTAAIVEVVGHERLLNDAPLHAVYRLGLRHIRSLAGDLASRTSQVEDLQQLLDEIAVATGPKAVDWRELPRVVRTLGAELARERERAQAARNDLIAEGLARNDLERMFAAERELREKAESSARQLCAKHRGVPFADCPQCWGEATVERAKRAERELAEARRERDDWREARDCLAKLLNEHGEAADRLVPASSVPPCDLGRSKTIVALELLAARAEFAERERDALRGEVERLREDMNTTQNYMASRDYGMASECLSAALGRAGEEG